MDPRTTIVRQHRRRRQFSQGGSTRPDLRDYSPGLQPLAIIRPPLPGPAGQAGIGRTVGGAGDCGLANGLAGGIFTRSTRGLESYRIRPSEYTGGYTTQPFVVDPFPYALRRT